VERGDRPRVVEEAVRVADRRLETKAVLDVLLAVAVVVDVEGTSSPKAAKFGPPAGSSSGM